MIGTINCVYETPCGWCSKWDKKCNKNTSEKKTCVHHAWVEEQKGIYKCAKCGIIYDGLFLI
jgi:hypothetical protein